MGAWALSFLAVGIGAALGAWLRWGLSIAFNPVFTWIPLGTLAANLVGGLLMGIAMGFITHYDAMSPQLRLLVTTGFLGGLTTFSTFSGEATSLLLRGQLGWTAALVLLHVVGSIACTFAGLALAQLFLARA
jgi:CrcB protein